MKRRYLGLPLAALLALLLAVSALAGDPFPARGRQIGYVTDAAGIMEPAQRQELAQRAEAISRQYDFGVYIITMDDFRDVTDSCDVFDGAATLYKEYDLGVGDERRGVLLLLSMNDRDFSLVTYSDYGNYVFDRETREEMTDWFLDDFARDDWFGGFADYLAACQRYLADGPAKRQSDIVARIGLIFFLPLIAAVVVVFILGLKMKSVARAVQAGDYAGAGLILTDSYDLFTHATETRRKRESESTRSGGSGSIRSSSSGGFGGTSGKF